TVPINGNGSKAGEPCEPECLRAACRRVYPMRPAVPVPASVAVDASAVDAHGIAHTQAIQRILREGALAPVAGLHRDAIGFVATAALLDLVARERTARGTGDRRGRVAAAAADL